MSVLCSVAQLCLTLCFFFFFFKHTQHQSKVSCCHARLFCDPVDCSPAGSSVHGISRARILEWGAISFSRGYSRPGDRTRVSCIAGRRFTIWATREALQNKIYRELKITFKRKSRVKILHNFSEKIVYGKNANYLITLNLNSQKAGSYKCLLVTEFFLSL